MVPESTPEKTAQGLVPRGDGWFVLGLREATWRHAHGRGAVCVAIDNFEGERRPVQLALNPFVLMPGEPMAQYHWEADQEDFLIVSGQATLIIEGEERALQAWDLVHCPPRVPHTIVGPGLVLAVGARKEKGSARYPVEPAAIRHDAGVRSDDEAPYERFPPPAIGPAPPLT